MDKMFNKDEEIGCLPSFIKWVQNFIEAGISLRKNNFRSVVFRIFVCALSSLVL